MSYKLQNVEGAKLEELTLTSDLNTFCVKQADKYTITLTRYHSYADLVAKFFTADDAAPVIIVASKHQNTVKILAEENPATNPS